MNMNAYIEVCIILSYYSYNDFLSTLLKQNLVVRHDFQVLKNEDKKKIKESLPHHDKNIDYKNLPLLFLRY